MTSNERYNILIKTSKFLIFDTCATFKFLSQTKFRYMYINLTLSVKNKKDAFVSKAPFTLMNKQVKNKSKQGGAKTTKSLSTGERETE